MHALLHLCEGTDLIPPWTIDWSDQSSESDLVIDELFSSSDPKSLCSVSTRILHRKILEVAISNQYIITLIYL